MHQATSQAFDGWSDSATRKKHAALPALLLSVVDIGLALVVCAAPFFFGGRHDFGRLVLVSLIAVTAFAWFVRQALLPEAVWATTRIYLLLLLAVGMLVCQVTPLPFDWISRLSPSTAQLLPLWSPGSGDAQQGTWQTLSLIPHETTKSLAMFVSYGLLFAVVVGRIREVDDVRRILGFISAAAVLMAIFGLLQYFTSNGRFFWFYTHPHRVARGLSGAFINRNHFAHFIVLGVGPLVALAKHLWESRPSFAPSKPAAYSARQIAALVVSAMLVVVILTSLASCSRGGLIALLAAAATYTAFLIWRGLADHGFLYGFVGLAAIVAAFLAWSGYDHVADRLDDLAQGSLEELDHQGMRRKVWAANIDAITAFPWTGTGTGSHREICPVYFNETFDKEYSHAENGYLQIATENGVGGLALLVAGLGAIGVWCMRCLRASQPAAEVSWFAAAAAGLAASVVHSAVDFVWYIPACMSVTIVLGACVLRLSQIAGASPAGSTAARVLPRGRWLEIAAVVILLGAWTTHTYVGPGIAAIHWDRYLCASVAAGKLADQTVDSLVDGEDIGFQDERRTLSQLMLRHLDATLYWDPQFARAHRRLADRYMAEFELGVSGAANIMDVTQIRNAAMASSFGSVGELQSWLVRAFGPRVKFLQRAQWHAQRAAELCPLQGDVYLQMAALTFLDLGSPAKIESFVNQGLRVRPYDRNVLTKAGLQELLLERIDLAIGHWSRCFNTSGRHQQEIIYRLVTSGMPAEEFLAKFRPDWSTLREVWGQYRKYQDARQLDDILTYAEMETRREISTPGTISRASVWLWQSGLYADVGRQAESLACLQRAYACDPRQYYIRYTLANALQANQQFAEAEPHVRWCLARRPSDKSLHRSLERISKAIREQRGTENAFDSHWKPKVSLANPINSSDTSRK